ncbi:tonoplast dicarboxylate transporter-like [Zerene cesonia]|uniref:tonoplast dicarboxylate transporter-like n=1 Tax=Zerene cesonia TaxID=33412 RepID=UPI0018E59257|nr:tonoplast dicarboxylate transporter-like [Zerene cesonia]
MGIVTSIFGPRDPKTPVKGFFPRIKNILKEHHRGVIGVLVPILLLSWQPEKNRHDITVKCMWIMMFWFFLWQPVNVPVVGLVPVFLLPMAGVMATADVCSAYFNENIALFILSGMVLLLLNMSNVDRRIILWLLCSGDNCQFSGKRLVFKSSVAAFFLSMFSSRLIVTSSIVQYLTPAYMSLQSSTARYRDTEPNYDTMRHVVLNSVQTASAIGSTAIMHSAYATLAMRAVFAAQGDKNVEYPDIFNFMQWSFFAFPIAFLMFILNMCYHMLLINWVVGKPMSASSMTEMRNLLLKCKANIPKRVSRHEKLTVLGSILYVAALFFRWSRWSSVSWSKFQTVPNYDNIPMIKDGTVAAIFVLALHVIPRTCGWARILAADKKSECGSLKPDSAIMWWRFVDKNSNYGYIILLGSGIALNRAVIQSGLNAKVISDYGTFITNQPWNTQMLYISAISAVLSNIMSGVAACIIFLPLVLNMGVREGETPSRWAKESYLGAIGVGYASSFGFMIPFLYTPAYFCHYTGKVPIKKMIKYSIGSLIICVIILWIALCVWAPVIWDPNGTGFEPVTIAAAAAEAPPAEGGGEGGEEGGGEGLR